MSTSRVTVTLNNRERAALARLADAELRLMRDQARLLLREALKNRGLLESRRDCEEAEPRRETA